MKISLCHQEAKFRFKNSGHTSLKEVKQTTNSPKKENKNKKGMAMHIGYLYLKIFDINS